MNRNSISRIRRSRYARRAKRIDVLGTATAAECRMFAFYLYEICADDFDEYDSDVVGCAAQLLVRLAEKLGRRDALASDLDLKVFFMVREGKLSTLSEKCDLCFDYSSEPYLYEEDKSIDRNIPSCLRGIDALMLNLFRCMERGGDRQLFARLVANYLVRRTPSEDMRLLDSVPAAVQKAADSTREVDFVSSAVGLSADEARLLAFYCRIYTCNLLRNLYAEFSCEQKHELNRRILGMTPRAYSSLIRSDGKLRSFGFVDDGGFIEEDFLECVEAQSMQPYFSDLLTEFSGESYPLESFNVNADTATIMRRMLSGTEPVSLMLYGKPGSGKTEFAKAIAAATGQKTYIFKNERELAQKNDGAALCRLNCLLSFAQPGAVFVIDEADTLLRTRDTSFFGMTMPSATKGTVNKMLEASRNKAVWIVNFTEQIDESTLRRFTYSYRFEAMPREQLRAIAETKLAPLALDAGTGAQILDLMERYSVTGSSVDNVVKTIKCLGGNASVNDGQHTVISAGSITASSLVTCVQSVLKENALLIHGKNRMRETTVERYDTRALNASMNPEQIVGMVRNAERFAEKSRAGNGTDGIRMLFYGLSGTGKTEFARYIAQSLGKKILLRRASDILGMYVGQNEQNIRDAFEEAERTKSILLFDEADSFFADRTTAVRSWERTMVNEFLTQMEEFSGILICTTNLKQIMDAAMNRRFHLIVEFKPLTADGIRCMLERCFAGTDFAPEQLARLERRGTVTPGDFGALASRVRFMPESERSAAYLTDELLKMQDEKDGGHRIGFSA